MTDREPQPSALPAEAAERRSDEVDYLDRAEWQAARNRYRRMQRSEDERKPSEEDQT